MLSVIQMGLIHGLYPMNYSGSCLVPSPRGGSGRPCSPVPSQHFSQGFCSSVAESSLLPASSLVFLVAKGNFPDIRIFVQWILVKNFLPCVYTSFWESCCRSAWGWLNVRLCSLTCCLLDNEREILREAEHLHLCLHSFISWQEMEFHPAPFHAAIFF